MRNSRTRLNLAKVLHSKKGKWISVQALSIAANVKTGAQSYFMRAPVRLGLVKKERKVNYPAGLGGIVQVEVNYMLVEDLTPDQLAKAMLPELTPTIFIG